MAKKKSLAAKRANKSCKFGFRKGSHICRKTPRRKKK
jgi:hypothetical protein